jgi:hypothetical protein
MQEAAASSVAITTLVSRTAKTDGVDARRSASSTSRYAAADSTPAKTALGEIARRTRMTPTRGG